MDYGGPKREFFRLLIEKIAQSDYMHGGILKFFTANVPAIQVSIYPCLKCLFQFYIL